MRNSITIKVQGGDDWTISFQENWEGNKVESYKLDFKKNNVTCKTDPKERIWAKHVKVIEDLAKKQKPSYRSLYVYGTGEGKSFKQILLALKMLSQQKTVAMCTVSDILADQLKDDFKRVLPEDLVNELEKSGQLTFITHQQMLDGKQTSDVICVDEVHQVAKTEQELVTFNQNIEDKVVFGFTATPNDSLTTKCDFALKDFSVRNPLKLDNTDHKRVELADIKDTKNKTPWYKPITKLKQYAANQIASVLVSASHSPVDKVSSTLAKTQSTNNSDDISSQKILMITDNPDDVVNVYLRLQEKGQDPNKAQTERLTKRYLGDIKDSDDTDKKFQTQETYSKGYTHRSPFYQHMIETKLLGMNSEFNPQSSQLKDQIETILKSQIRKHIEAINAHQNQANNLNDDQKVDSYLQAQFGALYNQNTELDFFKTLKELLNHQLTTSEGIEECEEFKKYFQSYAAITIAHDFSNAEIEFENNQAYSGIDRKKYFQKTNFFGLANQNIEGKTDFAEPPVSTPLLIDQYDIAATYSKITMQPSCCDQQILVDAYKKGFIPLMMSNPPGLGTGFNDENLSRVVNVCQHTTANQNIQVEGRIRDKVKKRQIISDQDMKKIYQELQSSKTPDKKLTTLNHFNEQTHLAQLPIMGEKLAIRIYCALLQDPNTNLNTLFEKQVKETLVQLDTRFNFDHKKTKQYAHEVFKHANTHLTQILDRIDNHLSFPETLQKLIKNIPTGRLDTASDKPKIEDRISDINEEMDKLITKHLEKNLSLTNLARYYPIFNEILSQAAPICQDALQGSSLQKFSSLTQLTNSIKGQEQELTKALLPLVKIIHSALSTGQEAPFNNDKLQKFLENFEYHAKTIKKFQEQINSQDQYDHKLTELIIRQNQAKLCTSDTGVNHLKVLNAPKVVFNCTVNTLQYLFGVPQTEIDSYINGKLCLNVDSKASRESAKKLLPVIYTLDQLFDKKTPLSELDLANIVKAFTGKNDVNVSDLYNIYQAIYAEQTAYKISNLASLDSHKSSKLSGEISNIANYLIDSLPFNQIIDLIFDHKEDLKQIVTDTENPCANKNYFEDLLGPSLSGLLVYITDEELTKDKFKQELKDLFCANDSSKDCLTVLASLSKSEELSGLKQVFATAIKENFQVGAGLKELMKENQSIQKKFKTLSSYITDKGCRKNINNFVRAKALAFIKAQPTKYLIDLLFHDDVKGLINKALASLNDSQKEQLLGKPLAILAKYLTDENSTKEKVNKDLEKLINELAPSEPQNSNDLLSKLAKDGQGLSNTGLEEFLKAAIEVDFKILDDIDPDYFVLPIMLNTKFPDVADKSAMIDQLKTGIDSANKLHTENNKQKEPLIQITQAMAKLTNQLYTQKLEQYRKKHWFKYRCYKIACSPWFMLVLANSLTLSALAAALWSLNLLTPIILGYLSLALIPTLMHGLLMRQKNGLNRWRHALTTILTSCLMTAALFAISTQVLMLTGIALTVIGIGVPLTYLISSITLNALLPKPFEMLDENLKDYTEEKDNKFTIDLAEMAQSILSTRDLSAKKDDVIDECGCKPFSPSNAFELIQCPTQTK
jgi:DNA-directed RNA polymerase subunit F